MRAASKHRICYVCQMNTNIVLYTHIYLPCLLPLFWLCTPNPDLFPFYITQTRIIALETPISLANRCLIHRCRNQKSSRYLLGKRSNVLSRSLTVPVRKKASSLIDQPEDVLLSHLSKERVISILRPPYNSCTRATTHTHTHTQTKGEIVYSQVKEQLPEYGKENALQTIRNDSRLETPPKKAENPVLQNNQSCGLGCTNTTTKRGSS